MRKITVAVDDETYRRVQIKAAERDSSVSVIVREYLRDLVDAETEFERLKREEAAIRSTITGFNASDRLSREEVHERKR